MAAEIDTLTTGRSIGSTSGQQPPRTGAVVDTYGTAMAGSFMSACPAVGTQRGRREPVRVALGVASIATRVEDGVETSSAYTSPTDWSYQDDTTNLLI